MLIAVHRCPVCGRTEECLLPEDEPRFCDHPEVASVILMWRILVWVGFQIDTVAV